MIPARKVTFDDLPMPAFDGMRIYRGHLAGINRQPSDTRLLRLLPQHVRVTRHHGQKAWEGTDRTRTFRPFCVTLSVTLTARNPLYPASPA